MTILLQSFFTFVGRHFMSFSFLTAWHNIKNLKFENSNVKLGTINAIYTPSPNQFAKILSFR